MKASDALRADVQATIDFIKENILNNVEGLRPGKVQALKDAVAAAQKTCSMIRMQAQMS